LTLCALGLYFEVLLAALATISVAVACAAALEVARDLRFREWWRKRQGRG